MSKRIFTQEEIEQLTANENVAACSEKSITYTVHFKRDAVKMYEQGMTSSEIFKQAGLSPHIVGREQSKQCLGRWRKIVKRKSLDGLKEVRGGNGGRPKTKYSSDKEKIEYLEAKVAYLKAENDFLAKLRAGKAE